MAGIAFEKHTLPNGLDVILHQDRSIPVAAVNVWYHVGSKDEEVGRTGFAHLFEHIMFRGTKHHKTSHFEPLQKIGATLNGSTTGDRTNYWEDVPSNYLELALWLEADRMGFLLDALDQEGFDTERDVVKNERRQSYENRPYGMAQWHIQQALFPMPHPLPLDDHRVAGRFGRGQPGRREGLFSGVTTRRPTPAWPLPATLTPARRWHWRNGISPTLTPGRRCDASPAPIHLWPGGLTWK